MADGDEKVPTKGNSLLVVSIVLLSIANVFYIFRFLTRMVKKQVGVDDYVLGLAAITLNLQIIFGFCAIHYGLGKHGADLSPESLHEALLYFYLIQVMYKILGGFAKAAFVLLYLRIFATQRFQWFAKWIVLNAAILSSIAFTFATIFQCQPIELAWNKSLHGHCIDNTAFWYSHAAVHTFLDLVIFSMPIPLVWKLHMPVQKKIGLALLFVLGFFACIASVLRMTALDGSAHSKDPTWGSYMAIMWTAVEANVSVICACLPPLRGPALQAIRHARGVEGGLSSDHPYSLNQISSPRRQHVSVMDANVGQWQTQVDKDSYSVRVKDGTERSGSEDSIVQHDIPGITKTTHWEVLQSVDSHRASLEKVHSEA